MEIKKYFLGLALASMGVLSANAAWDTYGFLYPEDEPDDIWEEWEFFAKCDIKLSGLNDGFNYYDKDVRKRVSKDPENHKFQWAVDKYFANGFDLIIEYDPDNDTFRIPITYRGVVSNWDGEPHLVTDWHTFYGTDDPYSSWDEVNGVLSIFTMSYYPNQDLGDGTFGDRETWYGTDVITFQGFTKYDVDIVTDECANEREISVDLEMTVHPKNVSWELLNEYIDIFDTEKLAEIAARAENPITESTTINVTLKEGPNSIVVSSYDDKNKLVSSIKNIYCMPEDSDSWVSLGIGKFTEDAVCDVEEDIITVDVEIQENKDVPGFYRLVDPYKAVASNYDEQEYQHDGHPHYLYLNASKPNQVILEASHTGVYNTRLKSEAYISSKAYEMKLEGKLLPDYADYLGKLEDGVITFPTKSLLLRFPEYTKTVSEEVVYEVNIFGSFKVELPSAGVASIINGEEGEVEYFTLQGVRVANPEAGQVVIARKNGKAVKMIYNK